MQLQSLFNYVFREKYISYNCENISKRKLDRYNEILDLKDLAQSKLNEVEHIIRRIKNKNLRYRLYNLQQICTEYSEYILDIINFENDIVFIRNYYNLVLIHKRITKLVDLLLKLSMSIRQYNIIEKIKYKLEKIELIIVSEQINYNSNQMLINN